MNSEDANHLDLLALFHYIVGGIMALFSCFPFIHVFVGLAIALGTFGESAEASSQSADAAFGWFFVIMGSLFILFGWAVSICIIVAGRKLKQRTNRMFCMVVAGLECMFMPFGTVLGVFTLIVLNKESVKQAYAQPLSEA
jgi:hypothetical protein